MNAEDLALVFKTNLVIIRKRYALGFYTASRPKALLNLYYRYIIVILIYNPEGGPYKIMLKFIFEFTKEYLSIKEANTFPIPKIIFNPLLILSPYQLSKLYIKPRHNKLPLPLRSNLDNIPIFRRLIKTPYGHKIKDLSVITGFRQVARLYSLYYSAGKAFNKNKKLIKAVYRISQLINPRRLQHLITEQSLSLKLSLKRKPAGKITNKRQSQRNALLKNIKKNWDNKQAIINIERQLSRDKFTIITLPGVSLEDKIRRRNNAINTVVDYCNVEKGRSRTDITLGKVKIKEDAKILEAAKALKRAKLSLYKEKRPKIYFICLGNKNLIISKRIYKFYTLAALIKYF
ncbi:hypothetical protein V2W45_1465928 [Cenococcum geophilum]